jgi:hypothetical protein
MCLLIRVYVPNVRLLIVSVLLVTLLVVSFLSDICSYGSYKYPIDPQPLIPLDSWRALR